MNKQEEFEWVVKVIKSCKTFLQIVSSDRLINLYAKRYPDYTALTELISIRNNHYTTIREKDTLT